VPLVLNQLRSKISVSIELRRLLKKIVGRFWQELQSGLTATSRSNPPEVLVRALSDEYREAEIRVNAISPADVNTAPTRAHFPDDAATGLAPSDVADAVAWLFDSTWRHVSGQTIALPRRDP